MSKLLISSQSLMESEKALKVSPVLAMEIGLNGAIFLEQTFLLDKQSECHFVDGHYRDQGSKYSDRSVIGG